jgi:hypothetical protein
MQRRKRWERTLLVKIEGEPASKGRRGSQVAPQIQQQVIECMKMCGRYPFTGAVALDVRFTSMRRNPPMIHRAAKYLLDVLGPALPATAEPRRRSVLYHDDRQVKFLFVDLSQRWDPRSDQDAKQSGSAWLTARPARDAVADLCVAYQLDIEDDDIRYGCDAYDLDDNETSPFVVPDMPDDFDWFDETPLVDPTPLESWFEERVRFQRFMDLQESILARTDALLARSFAGWIPGEQTATEDVCSPVRGCAPPTPRAAAFEPNIDPVA